MSRKRVIARKALPMNTPLWACVTLGLLLDRYSVPNWAWFIYGLVAAIWMATFFVRLGAEDQVDPFQ